MAKGDSPILISYPEVNKIFGWGSKYKDPENAPIEEEQIEKLVTEGWFWISIFYDLTL